MNKIKELTVKPINIANIESNFEDVKGSLEVILKSYQGLVFTDTAIKEAKQSRASLNKLKKAINDKKIEIKKQYLQPYTDFEDKVKILMGMVDVPCELIDTQCKVFEEKRISDKREYIENIIKDVVENDLLKIDVSEKWLNASVTTNQIKESIASICESFEKDMDSVSLLKSDFEGELQDVIIAGGDMSEVLQEKARLEVLQEKFKEKELAKTEVEKEVVTVKDEPLATMYLDDEGKPRIITNDFQKTETFTLKITCTVSDSIKLKLFMQENNIKTERLK